MKKYKDNVAGFFLTKLIQLKALFFSEIVATLQCWKCSFYYETIVVMMITCNFVLAFQYP